MKNVPIVLCAAVLLAAGHSFAAQEGTLQIQLQPGGNPGGGVVSGAIQPGLNPFGGGKSTAGWYIESIERTVPLTPQQKEAMTKIIEARDKAIQEFQTKNADKLGTAMQAMTEAYQSKDKEAIARAQKNYQEANAETIRFGQQAQKELEGVLTPEQKAKRQEVMTAQIIKSMTEPAVLTEEQVARLKEILSKGNGGGERLERESYQALQDVLTADQKAAVARHRALANAKAGFARANLTAEQWQKVEAAYAELAGTPQANGEALTKQLAERVHGLLTPEQKEAMKMGGWGLAQVAPQAGASRGGAPQLGSPQGGSPQTGAPGQPINRAPGSPQIVTLGERGEGVTVTINGEGKVSAQGGAAGGAGRTYWLGEGRAQMERGTWLGITTEPVSEPLRAQLSLAKGEGLLIQQVVSRSPAAAAGLLPNDILVRLDDQIIVELSQLKTLIAMKKAGDQVKLVFVRKAVRQEATATLAEHEVEASEHGGLQWSQANPGLTFRIEEGGREAQERPGQQQSSKGNPPKFTPENGNRFFAPAQGAQLNPNPWKREQADATLENLRRQLESSGLTAEAKDQIRKSIDQAKMATDKARAGLEEALKQAANVPREGGFKPGDPQKPAPKPQP